MNIKKNIITVIKCKLKSIVARNTSSHIFKSDDVPPALDILEAALKKRCPNITSDGSQSYEIDRYIVEYLKNLLLPDPKRNDSIKPFKDWFNDELSIQSIHDLEAVFSKMPTELELACTAHPVDVRRASTEQRVVSDIQKIEEHIHALRSQLLGEKTNGTIQAQQRIVDTIRREKEQLEMRVNELATSDPRRIEKQNIRAEWFGLFVSKVASAADEIDSREGRATFLVKECVAEMAAEFLLAGNISHKSELNAILDSTRNDHRLNELLQHPAMNKSYPTLMKKLRNYSLTIKYSRWIFDGDGHSGVTASLGIHTCMLILKSILDPLISRGTDYRMGLDSNLLTADQQAAVKKQLGVLDRPKINDLTSDTWKKAQQLNVAASRLVDVLDDTMITELTTFPFDIMANFKENVRVLASIESEHKINGQWHALYKHIQKHGMFGSPVGRKGHADILEALLDIATLIGINQEQPTLAILNDITTNRDINLGQLMPQLSEQSQQLCTMLRALSLLDPSMVIQSDSPADIELAITTMKTLRTVMGLSCPMTLLFEDYAAMSAIINFIDGHSKDTCQTIFDGIMVMSAGSDNQKRCTFMLSDPLNIKLANLCAEKGVPFKFGRGDSEARSRRLGLPYSSITIQPGTVSRFTNGLIRTELLIKYCFSMDAKHVAIQQMIGGHYYQMFQAHLQTQHQLVEMIQSLDASSKAFSRPASKGAITCEPHDYLSNNIRAINGARCDLLTGSLNRAFPNNPAKIIQAYIEEKVQANALNWVDIYDAYNNERFQSIMAYYHMVAGGDEVAHLKAAYPDAYTVTKDDIERMHQLLTGQPLIPSNYYIERCQRLREQRTLFFHADTPEKKELAKGLLELV